MDHYFSLQKLGMEFGRVAWVKNYLGEGWQFQRVHSNTRGQRGGRTFHQDPVKAIPRAWKDFDCIRIEIEK